MKVNSDQIIKLRSKKNWSQEQLSEACGLSLRTVQRIENTGNASIESIRVLASIFNVDPNELKVDNDEMGYLVLQALKNGFVKFADFSGNASRFEYWWFFLFIILILAIAEVVNFQVLQIVSIIFLLPLISYGTRRLNDTGRSGWWQLLSLVPFGIIPVLFLLAEDTQMKTRNQTN